MKRKYKMVFLRGECHGDMVLAVREMERHGALYLGCTSTLVGYGPDCTYVYELRVACENTCPLPTGAETARGADHRIAFGGKPRTFDVEVQAGFNPDTVRFEPGRRTSNTAPSPRFNPDTVRFEHAGWVEA